MTIKSYLLSNGYRKFHTSSSSVYSIDFVVQLCKITFVEYDMYFGSKVVSTVMIGSDAQCSMSRYSVRITCSVSIFTIGL